MKTPVQELLELFLHIKHHKIINSKNSQITLLYPANNNNVRSIHSQRLNCERGRGGWGSDMTLG